MSEKSNLLADHYQKTYEVTLAVWEQRNVTFLILIVVVGIAALLTFNVEQAQPLMVDLISKTFAVESAERQKELRASFPYGVLKSVLMMIVLYLMLVLYHRTIFVTRNYQYLEALEAEIRQDMGIATGAIAFSREGSFYLKTKPFLASSVGAAYVGMLGLLLASFLGMRLYTDYSENNKLFFFSDLVLSLSIALFFVGYSMASLRRFATNIP